MYYLVSLSWQKRWRERELEKQKLNVSRTVTDLWQLAMKLVKSKIIGLVTVKQPTDLAWLKECFWLTV